MTFNNVDGLYSNINRDESLGKFACLPNEVIARIMNEMSEKELGACREVSKAFNYLVEKEICQIPGGFEMVAMRVFSKYVETGQPEQATKFIQRLQNKEREQDIYKSILLDSISMRNLTVMKMAMSTLAFNINSLEFDGKTLLHYAEEHNFTEGIDWLKQQEGIDPTTVDIAGRTAAEHGQLIRTSRFSQLSPSIMMGFGGCLNLRI